jgi:hypothetical protein
MDECAGIAAGRITGKPDAAGKIHVLDMAALKEQIGPKWQRMASHVQMFFEASIKRQLAPGDVFYRVAELSYLVVFRDVDDVGAELKCAAISEEVCQRLFGENGAGVMMRNLIGRVSFADLPKGAARQTALNKQLEHKGREILVNGQSPVSRSLMSTAPDRELKVRAAADTSPRRVALKEIAFTYRPVWDTAKHAVLSYLCQPLIAGSGLPELGYLSPEEGADTTLLDQLALEHCIDQAVRLRTTGVRIVIAVPVHFLTISRMKSWEVYCAAYRRMPAEVQRDIAFVVTGIDRGVPHIRLVQEIPKLAVSAYRVLCHIAESDGAGVRFASTGAHGIGIAITRSDSEPQTVILMKQIARESQTAKVDSFLLGIQSTSIALAAVEAGVRYLEGPAIRPAVTDPRHAFAHDVEGLYRRRRS